jgi:hypothetical protein
MASCYIYTITALLQYKVIYNLKSFNKLDNYFYIRLVGTFLNTCYFDLGPYYILLNSIYTGYLVKL